MIEYPCSLPGVLVNSNAYQIQNKVERNDLSSGPPIFRLRTDDGWVAFDVTWSFSALEMQIFNAFYRYNLSNGSKSFSIGLMIDGWDGTSNTKDHECYFDGAYSVQQVGRRWMVTARLIAIQQEDIGECEALSLVAVSQYGDPKSITDGMEAATQQIIIDWLP